MENIVLEFKDRYQRHIGGAGGEQYADPEDKDKDQSQELFSKIYKAATKYGAETQHGREESKQELEHYEHGGFSFSIAQYLTLTFGSTAALIAFLKFCRSIAVQWMKNRGSRYVRLKKGDIEIYIHGSKDIKKAIEHIQELQDSTHIITKGKE